VDNVETPNDWQAAGGIVDRWSKIKKSGARCMEGGGNSAAENISNRKGNQGVTRETTGVDTGGSQTEAKRGGGGDEGAKTKLLIKEKHEHSVTGGDWYGSKWGTQS